MSDMTQSDGLPETVRRGRQTDRRGAISELVMSEGAVRIEDLAERFGVSLMTVHRDLDDLETRGLLRKNRGIATVLSTSLVESSDVYRSARQSAEKEMIALAAMEFVEPGQAIMLDDSTTTLHLIPHLAKKTPLTVITNTLTVMNELRSISGISMIGIGGQYYNWCSAYMGRMASSAIDGLRADVMFMSTSAISDDIAFHQTLETVDVKRSMFESSTRRVLLVDHTKFGNRALHAMLPLADFDAVICDAATNQEHIDRLRGRGVNVVVAKSSSHSHSHAHAR